MQMNECPLISVAMGVYYRRADLDLLRRSVNSILNQTYPFFEFLICDDGSTSEARQLLEEFFEKDSRIRLIRPGNKITLGSKLNACIERAGGDFIARMDDDDFADPERFEKQLEYLKAHPEAAFVGSSVRLWCNNCIVGKRILPYHPTVEDFFLTQPFIHPSMMFRKEPLLQIGGYSEKKHQILCEDYDLLLRLYSAGYVGRNLNATLLDYSVPGKGRGRRRMKHRWNETITRYQRFRELHLFPRCIPYVIKPLIVGLLPWQMILYIRKKNEESLFDNSSI